MLRKLKIDITRNQIKCLAFNYLLVSNAKWTWKKTSWFWA